MWELYLECKSVENFIRSVLQFELVGVLVIAGLKSVEFDSDTPSLYTYPISFSTSGDVLSVIHHDVRELESVGDRVYVTTKYGITVIDYNIGSSVDYWMPQGVILEDSELLFDSDQELYAPKRLIPCGNTLMRLIDRRKKSCRRLRLRFMR